MIWLTGGNVYDVAQGKFAQKAIGIRDGRIEALTAGPTPATGDRVIDMSGSWLLPGQEAADAVAIRRLDGGQTRATAF